MNNRFYTYAWLRENGVPFYIGKGCGKRAWRNNSLSKNKVLILKRNLTERDALSHEKYMIFLYKEHLHNVLPGGGAEAGIEYESIDPDDYVSCVSKTLFGNKTAACILQYIEERGECHASKIARVFGFGLNMTQRQLKKLEESYVLVSKRIGNVRVYKFNDRLPTVKHLRSFLRSEISSSVR